VVQFLDHLEKDRDASVSTRNQRLAALRSLCRYILFRHPNQANTISRCLAVPMKKHARKMRGFLETNEVEALLGAIDRRKWIGRRNYLMLNLAIRTGLRVSELTALRAEDFTLGRTPYITVQGKGRKERSVPIDKSLAKAISSWLTSSLSNSATAIFPTGNGRKMSTDAVQHMLTKYVKIAEKNVPTLKRKRISPHTLRHTTAMQMLNRGVAIEIIALWLGHEQIETTQIYFSESIAIKRKALTRTRFKSIIQPPIRKSTDLSFLDDI
jgi:site-specific recombinase XerD